MAKQDPSRTPQQGDSIDDELIRGGDETDDLAEDTDDEFDDEELEDEEDEEEGGI
ncbi:MAG: hypothetical protein V7647_3155 [Acidobacteriota bacterium]|jgi:hypothetical protein